MCHQKGPFLRQILLLSLVIGQALFQHSSTNELHLRFVVFLLNLKEIYKTPSSPPSHPSPQSPHPALLPFLPQQPTRNLIYHRLPGGPQFAYLPSSSILMFLFYIVHSLENNAEANIFITFQQLS
jgi:hypothetical protein